MMLNKLSLLLTLVLVVVPSSLVLVQAGSAWSQLGQSICSTEGSLLGYAVDIVESSTNSGDDSGSTSLMLAIGSPKYSTMTSRNVGKVQVYKFEQDQCLWLPHGPPIVGEEFEDQLGTKVALSCDGSVLAVSGDTTHDGSLLRSGMVRVYEKKKNNNNDNDNDNNDNKNDKDAWWVPRGMKIPTLVTNFGFQLAMSCSGDIIAVGAFGYAKAYLYDESEKEYKSMGNTIVQLQQQVDSSPNNMLTALSRDGTTMIVGEQSSGPYGPTNPVKAYRYDPVKDEWNQLGNDMVPPNDVMDIGFPQHFAVSDDGSRVVVTCPGWSNSGQKQFGILAFDYQENDESWSIVGDTFHPSYGPRTDISGDGRLVFASSYGHHSYHDEVASSYTFVNSTSWLQSGAVYEVDPQHEKWGNDEEVIATTATGSVFAFGVTSGWEQAGGGSADDPSGIVHVFFNPAAQVVQSCLPDPSILDANCTELLGLEGFDSIGGFDDDHDHDSGTTSTQLHVLLSLVQLSFGLTSWF